MVLCNIVARFLVSNFGVYFVQRSVLNLQFSDMAKV